MDYRQLEPDEHPQTGDVFTDDISGPVEDRHKFLGWEAQHPASYWGISNQHQWFRPIHPIQKDNWIAFADRKPAKADAGKEGFVIVTNYEREIISFYVPGEEYGGYTHWMATNFVPRPETRVKVDGHEVVPQKDGSIKVGCQTVSKEDFDKIINQRNAAMKE